MISNTLYSAIKKSISGRLIVYLIQFSALALYARLFTPEEFGVIASIQVFVIFFQIIADVGIGPAIINEGKFEGNKRDGVFTVTALIGVALSIAFYLFSFVINGFYGGYEYQDVAAIVCVSVFFNSLNIIPMTAMNKDVNFLRIAMNDVLVEILTFFIVYSLYSFDAGVLALASRSAVQAVLRFSVTWLSSSKTSLGRPKFGIELYHIKSILGFSLYQFGFNFINYFSRNLDNILIAKYFGMNSVGIYDKSYQLMRYPLMLTTFAMTRAIQPVLTKFRDEKAKIIEEHNKLASRLFAISLPISFFMFFNGSSIVTVLFGEQWSEVTEFIKIFSIIIPIQSVLSTSGSFFQVMNKPKLLFITGFVAAVINISVITFGISLGEIRYVAIGLVFSFLFNFFQIYYVLFKFCFRANVLEFFALLFKVMVIMSFPILLYLTINLLFLQSLELSSLANVFLQIICGFISLAIFFRPIKNVLD